MHQYDKVKILEAIGFHFGTGQVTLHTSIDRIKEIISYYIMHHTLPVYVTLRRLTDDDIAKIIGHRYMSSSDVVWKHLRRVLPYYIRVDGDGYIDMMASKYLDLVKDYAMVSVVATSMDVTEDRIDDLMALIMM